MSAAVELPSSARRPLMSEAVLRDLRCPICRGPLDCAEDSCRCRSRDCQAAFPWLGRAPVLINEARSVFTIEGFLKQEPTFFKPTSKLRRWLSGCVPDLSHNLAARRVLMQMRELLVQRQQRPRVLVIGGSVVGVGVEAMHDDPAIELVESDAACGPRVQVVCDAHDLPFADGSFDGVIVQAVLEHVLDPQRCVGEIHRVLKAGGLVYADTPFVCQVHGREFDFTRYSRLGHRRLFRQFGELESGISSGPGMALGWTARYFLLSFFQHRLLRAGVSALARLTLFWLKYLDYLVLDNPSALDAAFAFYFLGEKRRESLADADLIRSYRGGF